MRSFSASTTLCFVVPAITVRKTPVSFVVAKYLSSPSWNFNLVTTFPSMEQRLEFSAVEDLHAEPNSFDEDDAGGGRDRSLQSQQRRRGNHASRFVWETSNSSSPPSTINFQLAKLERIAGCFFFAPCKKRQVVSGKATADVAFSICRLNKVGTTEAGPGGRFQSTSK